MPPRGVRADVPGFGSDHRPRRSHRPVASAERNLGSAAPSVTAVHCVTRAAAAYISSARAGSFASNARSPSARCALRSLTLASSSSISFFPGHRVDPRYGRFLGSVDVGELDERLGEADTP